MIVDLRYSLVAVKRQELAAGGTMFAMLTNRLCASALACTANNRKSALN